MTGEPEFVREPSTIEFGGPSGPGRRDRLLPVLIALVAGLALGFLIGRNHDGATDTPTASASASTASASASTASASASATTAEPEPITATGRTCAVTLPGPGGHDDLQLGAEIRNRGTRPVTLETPGVQLPMGGLTIAEPPTLGACGELPGITETVLTSGEGSWLSVRLHVPGGACPAALPVLFVIRYQVGPGDHGQANVGGFNDLGKVPYPSCPS